MTLHRHLAPAAVRTPVELRPAIPADAEAAGRIMYLAFRRIAESRGFPPDLPGVEVATGLAGALIADPAIFGIVAVQDGAVVGSNFLSEGDAVRGVGPITVEPDLQGAGIGRMLMQAVVDRGADALGVRLVQDAFNTVSMPLYASVGFDAREPLALLAGVPASAPAPGGGARPMTPADLGVADLLARRVHGFARGAALRGALGQGTPVVLEREGRVTAYMTSPGLWITNHAVAETEQDLKLLILGAAALTGQPVSFLAPIRRAALFRWALGQGLRVVKPMTLMTRGHYAEPQGGYLPSVFY